MDNKIKVEDIDNKINSLMLQIKELRNENIKLFSDVLKKTINQILTEKSHDMKYILEDLLKIDLKCFILSERESNMKETNTVESWKLHLYSKVFDVHHQGISNILHLILQEEDEDKILKNLLYLDFIYMPLADLNFYEDIYNYDRTSLREVVSDFKFKCFNGKIYDFTEYRNLFICIFDYYFYNHTEELYFGQSVFNGHAHKHMDVDHKLLRLYRLDPDLIEGFVSYLFNYDELDYKKLLEIFKLFFFDSDYKNNLRILKKMIKNSKSMGQLNTHSILAMDIFKILKDNMEMEQSKELLSYMMSETFV